LRPFLTLITSDIVCYIVIIYLNNVYVNVFESAKL
jgi:hypothetical protein